MSRYLIVTLIMVGLSSISARVHGQVNALQPIDLGGQIPQTLELDLPDIGIQVSGDTWHTTDPQGGVTRLIVYEDGQRIKAFGACTPTDCDWGGTDLEFYYDTIEGNTLKSVLAHWDHGFATRTMELCRREQQLSIKVWSRFTDDSNRNNYVMTHTLEPENTPIQFDVFPECPPPKGGECVIPSYSMDSGIFDVPLVNVKVFGEVFPYAVKLGNVPNADNFTLELLEATPQ